MIGKFNINANLRNKTVKDIYRRGCQLARVGYDPRTTLEPADSARFIHRTNLRIADLAHYSMINRPEPVQDNEIERLLYRLGERVERAQLRHDLMAVMCIDWQLDDVVTKNPTVKYKSIVLAGQNNIRRARGLKLWFA